VITAFTFIPFVHETQFKNCLFPLSASWDTADHKMTVCSEMSGVVFPRAASCENKVPYVMAIVLLIHNRF